MGQCRGPRGFRSQAPIPISAGKSTYIEHFLQKRAKVISGLSQHIQEITDHAPAGLPTVQPRAACWENASRREASARVGLDEGYPSTRRTAASGAYGSSCNAPHVARLGGMMAAEAPMKEQNDADRRRPRDEGPGGLVGRKWCPLRRVRRLRQLRRTPADLALGGITGGPIACPTRGERCCHAKSPRNLRARRPRLDGWDQQLRRGRCGHSTPGSKRAQ